MHRCLIWAFLVSVLAGFAAEADDENEVPVTNRLDEKACQRWPDAAPVNENGYAVIVGNKNYLRGIADVSYAHNNATAICEFVVNKLGYPLEQVFVLFDVTSVELEEWFGSSGEATSPLNRLTDVARPDREFFVYYAGHGQAVDGAANLLGSNASPKDMAVGLFPVDRISQSLEALDARRNFLMVDACFACTIGAEDDVEPVLSPTDKGGAIAEPTGNLLILSAANPGEPANWDPERKQTVLTNQFMDAASGRADRNGTEDGVVTMIELIEDLGRTVPNRSLRVTQGDTNRLQNPLMLGPRDLWSFPTGDTLPPPTPVAKDQQPAQ